MNIAPGAVKFVAVVMVTLKTPIGEIMVSD